MKRLTLILFIIFPTLCFCQETKKVTKKDKENYTTEVYYVLKSDLTTKQGFYEKKNYKGITIMTGYYKNGLKDSTWTEYSWDGKKTESKGNYLQDNQVGVWEYYDYKGNLEQKYDYTQKVIVYCRIEDEDKNKKYKVITATDTLITKLDQPPVYIGGMDQLYKQFSEILRYPQEAKETGKSGTVYIAFTIDKNGKTSNFHLIKGIGSGCDEEALRGAKLLKENWYPAQLNGQSVEVEYELPISFTLE
jgi:periplasmic protein TonB